jgi:hypothetical protein
MMRALPQSFWDRLYETPQRRAGGVVIGMSGPPEFRYRRQRFPRLERCKARLALLEALMEKENNK